MWMGDCLGKSVGVEWEGKNTEGWRGLEVDCIYAFEYSRMKSIKHYLNENGNIMKGVYFVGNCHKEIPLSWIVW
jgi:hypothetical protein